MKVNKPSRGTGDRPGKGLLWVRIAVGAQSPVLQPEVMSELNLEEQEIYFCRGAGVPVGREWLVQNHRSVMVPDTSSEP